MKRESETKIRDSVETARLKYRLKAERIKDFGDTMQSLRDSTKALSQVETMDDPTKINELVERANDAVDQFIFDTMKVSEGMVQRGRKNPSSSRQFRKTVLARAILAWNERDGNFFIRLGKALNQKSTAAQYDPLDVVLVEAWERIPGEDFGLCDCTDAAIYDYCAVMVKDDAVAVTMDNVTQRRKRCKLVKSQKPYVTSLTEKRKGKWVWSFSDRADKSKS